MILPTYKSLEEKKSNFTVCKQIDDPNNLKCYLEELERLPHIFKKWGIDRREPACIFRGVKEAKYKLYTSAQREWIKGDLSKKLGEDGFADFVDRVLYQLKKDTRLRNYLKTRGIIQNDMFLLSLLQHYGAPTPLLDFTYDREVALFFATREDEKSQSDETRETTEIDEYFSIYAFHTGTGKSVWLDDLGNEFIERYENKRREVDECWISLLQAKEDLGSDYLKYIISNMSYAWKLPLITPYNSDIRGLHNGTLPANHSLKVLPAIDDIKTSKIFPDIKLSWENPNIIAQKGCFVMNTDKDKPLEVMMGGLVQCLDIHKSLVKDIRKEYIHKAENEVIPEIQDESHPDFYSIAVEASRMFKEAPEDAPPIYSDPVSFMKATYDGHLPLGKSLQPDLPDSKD